MLSLPVNWKLIEQNEHANVNLKFTRVILAGCAVTGIQKLTNDETTIRILGMYFFTK